MFLKTIDEKYHSDKIDRCNEAGCGIRLDAKQRRIILSGEKVERTKSSQEKACDCIIFQNDKKVILVELKHKISHATAIREKFCNAIKRTTQIVHETSERVFTVHLVLLHGPITDSVVKELAPKIKVEGREYFIGRYRCGTSLKDVLGRNVSTPVKLSAG